ncbi:MULTISPECIES: hypothetical protein [Streptomyces]|uniref:Roadblock/LAMTOR2 domain-containing protein n=1 Tax=Streptomyces chengmaiensis TaxID=3040919 RepID=A0ABT6HN99_9ACTN|nr:MULTISPECIES: hypothetical protein [Streptomyces]MDH2389836.1 hypothetical protein [Streptomyces chengmaiensis]WRQ79748.1 hypothetical protein I3F59_010535 [Streptomyces sp. MUM 178J]
MPGIDECLLQAMVVPGARGASIVDWTSGLAIGSIGDSPGGDPEANAAETAELARMAAEYTSFTTRTADGGDGELGKGLPVEDLIVTAHNGYHIIRFVETDFDSSVFLHLWLDRDTGNLALARLRIADLAERLVL